MIKYTPLLNEAISGNYIDSFRDSRVAYEILRVAVRLAFFRRSGQVEASHLPQLERVVEVVSSEVRSNHRCAEYRKDVRMSD